MILARDTDELASTAVLLDPCRRRAGPAGHRGVEVPALEVAAANGTPSAGRDRVPCLEPVLAERHCSLQIPSRERGHGIAARPGPPPRRRPCRRGPQARKRLGSSSEVVNVAHPAAPPSAP